VEWRYAWSIGTGERAKGEAGRIISILSLWPNNSVPMAVGGERQARAGTTDIASKATGTSSHGLEKALA
jgi:hypothetical protein